MEKQKYYTPDISEFYVGFEFEVKGWVLDESTFPKGLTKELYHSIPFSKRIKKYPEVKANIHWYKQKWTIQSEYTDLFNVKYENGVLDNIWVGEEIRVKYLDKEDIESLGFEQDHNHNNVRFSYSNGVVRITHIPHKNNINIYQWGWEQDTVASIAIKNKSELKRLLTQIGVLS